MSEILLATKADVDAHAGRTDNPHQVTAAQLGLGYVVVNGGGVFSISVGKFADMPLHGFLGRVYFAYNTRQVFVDTGGEWAEVGRDPSLIGENDLGFDPATQDEANRITLDAVRALEETVQRALADLQAARDEIRLLVDHSVAKTAEINTLKDRVKAIEEPVAPVVETVERSGVK